VASVFVVLHLVLSLLGLHQATELLDRISGAAPAKTAVIRPDAIVASVTPTPSCRVAPRVEDVASDADSLIEFAATVVHEWWHLGTDARLVTTCRAPIVDRDGH
jgi:hypothetical protein